MQDILAGNLQDGNLLQHILFEIAKPQGKRKDFVKVQLKTTKNEVQEKDALIDKYTAIVSNHSSLGKVKQKQETWVLLAKLHYIQQARLLRQVDPDAAEKTAAAEDIGDEEGDVAPVPPCVPPRPLVSDTTSLLIVADQYSFDDNSLLIEVGECLREVNIGVVDASPVSTMGIMT